MRKILPILLILLAFTLFADEEKKVFMVYGTDFIVNIPLPKYWNVDMDFAQQNNINGFFYIKKYGIKNSPAGIVLTLATKPELDSKLSEYIAYDKNNLLSYYPDAKFSEYKTDFKQDHNYIFKIYDFLEKPNGHRQLIAYLDNGSKNLVKLYIDYQNGINKEQYLMDFINCIQGLSYFNVKVNVK